MWNIWSAETCTSELDMTVIVLEAGKVGLCEDFTMFGCLLLPGAGPRSWELSGFCRCCQGQEGAHWLQLLIVSHTHTNIICVSVLDITQFSVYQMLYSFAGTKHSSCILLFRCVSQDMAFLFLSHFTAGLLCVQLWTIMQHIPYQLCMCVCTHMHTHTCTLAITHTHIFLWLCLPCISAVMYSKCALNYQCSSLKSVHIQTDLALTGSLAVFDCWFANICMIKTRCFMNTHSVYRNSNFSLLSAHRFP